MRACGSAVALVEAVSTPSMPSGSFSAQSMVKPSWITPCSATRGSTRSRRLTYGPPKTMPGATIRLTTSCETHSCGMCFPAICSANKAALTRAAGTTTCTSTGSTGDSTKPRNVRKPALLLPTSAATKRITTSSRPAAPYWRQQTARLNRGTSLWQLARAGFSSLDEYYFIQGRNPDGTDNPELEVHVDIDALIDFMINVFYTGNEDMPTSLGSGGSANNFWAIRDRTSRAGWVFVAHDNEHNMLNVNENQTLDDSAGRSRASFNPKYLHQQLDELPEYQLRFADRVQKFFFNDGPLTTERARSQLESRAAQIDKAIIAESARWGDQHNEPPLTKQTWQTEVDWLADTFLARRGEIVLGQLRRKNLFPNTEAPTLNQHGGQVDDRFELVISAPVGTVYYTLDGTDPRLPGGALAPAARAFLMGGVLPLTADVMVRARVLDGTDWSPLTEAAFQVGTAGDATALRVAELHYNPAPTTPEEMAAGFNDKDDFEFIELVNISNKPIDLAGARLVQAVVDGAEEGVFFDFASAPNTRLGPGQRLLVVEDAAAFDFRYGDQLPVAGQWTGRLNNGSETITLQVDGVILQQFTYDDAWYPQTDGGGFSLEIVDVNNPNIGSWNQQSSWRPSGRVGGSPGVPSSPAAIPGDANGDGLFNSTDLVIVLQAGEYEDRIEDNSTFAEGDWNGDGDFDSSDLVLSLPDRAL